MKLSNLFISNIAAGARPPIFVLMACVAGFAGGGQPPNPAAPAEVHALNETQPAGETVQIKFMLTEPKPISSGTGGTSFDASLDSFDGIQLFSATGDVFGTALVQNGSVRIWYVSPNSTFGTSVDYPMLTIAARIRKDAPLGSKSQIGLDSGSFWANSTGTASAFVSKPGTITVGGSVSISNVIPGGGFYKAGTVIRVLGSGFQSKTSLQFSARPRSWQVVGTNEIDITLAEDTVMDGQKIQLKNPDGSSDAYFSYLRGIPQGQSLEPLLAATVPVFSTIAHYSASVQQFSQGLSNSVVTALAIQNSNADAANVQLEALDPFGQSVGIVTVTLPSGARITRSLGEYFGLALAAGSAVRVSASLPVQMLGVLADRSTAIVLPFSPAF